MCQNSRVFQCNVVACGFLVNNKMRNYSMREIIKIVNYIRNSLLTCYYNFVFPLFVVVVISIITNSTFIIVVVVVVIIFIIYYYYYYYH